MFWRLHIQICSFTSTFTFINYFFSRIFSQRKVFSMTSVWGSSFVSSAGGASMLLVSSSNREQHIFLAQAFPQARLQVRKGGREGSTLCTTGEASPSLPAEDPEQEANSG